MLAAMAQKYQDMSVEAEQLADYMEALSEDCWCATWMDGLDFALWYALQNGPTRYGHGQITEEHIDNLRRLSVQCRGWIRWSEQDRKVAFTPLIDWTRIYHAEPEPQRFF
jgi:hypothetical protein